MKVLHVCPTYFPATYWGGPIYSTYFLNRELRKTGVVDLRVLTTDSAGPSRKERINRETAKDLFDYQVIYAKRLFGVSISADLLKRLIYGVAWCDVVHLTATYSFPTIPTLIACKIFQKPVVWSLRGAILDDEKREQFETESIWKKFAKKAWLRLCARLWRDLNGWIHVTTKEELYASEKVFGNARWAVVPNGVDIPRKASEGGISTRRSEELRLIFLGRLVPKKGIENLLRAMALVGRGARLHIYGDATAGQGGRDYKERLLKLARELKILETKVFFHGFIQNQEKSLAFIKSDVCVIPSYSENFCNVVVESLAHGVPVIVSDKLPWKEIAEIGCGLVVSNESEELAKAIRKIEKMDLRKMGEIGRKWVAEKYSWNVVARQMLGVYKSVTGWQRKEAGAVLKGIKGAEGR